MTEQQLIERAEARRQRKLERNKRWVATYLFNYPRAIKLYRGGTW